MSLAKRVSIIDYKASSQDNQEFELTSSINKNEENDKDIIDDNANTVEKQGIILLKNKGEIQKTVTTIIDF